MSNTKIDSGDPTQTLDSTNLINKLVLEKKKVHHYMTHFF